MEPKIELLLRKLRKERGISCKEMSQALGCSSAMISAMEYGHKPIGELWARRFSQFFETQEWEQFLSEAKK